MLLLLGGIKVLVPNGNKFVLVITEFLQTPQGVGGTPMTFFVFNGISIVLALKMVKL